MTAPAADKSRKDVDDEEKKFKKMVARMQDSANERGEAKSARVWGPPSLRWFRLSHHLSGPKKMYQVYGMCFSTPLVSLV